MNLLSIVLKHATLRKTLWQKRLSTATGVLCALTLVVLALPLTALAASFSDAEKLYHRGDYAACTSICRSEVDRGIWNENWSQLLIRCYLTTGRYEAAKAVYETAIKRYSSSIQLRALARDIYRYNHDLAAAKKEFDQIYELVQRSAWRYTSARDQVVLGHYFLSNGEDARQVLEVLYDPAREKYPTDAEIHIAIAELALLKHDYQLAAQSLSQAVKFAANNPHVFYLQARAWAESDPQRADAALAKALELNPRHVPSLLLQIDALIDSERYDKATQALFDVLTINVYQPEAWAYHAVLAHLQGQFAGEKVLRQAALSKWRSNPQVDHLIGKKLSQKYRFAEGSDYQRRALQLDPTHTEAQFALAQDLLRLGQEPEGWQLAKQVFDDDNYNVVALNLVRLRDELQKFTTLERNGLVVRMDAREARIYGEQVLSLLSLAKKKLCAKYDIAPSKPIIVEIFPEQKDFAIRTFGLPGGAGFLGVCFGRVITANSPASQANAPANWQSVLWHEFCHVVTLEKTQNRMPRWLSEGISVYEERQQNNTWGQQMTPQYREMILGEDLVPVSQLSGAFLRPKSGLHLQYAYFQSSLVVEYLVEQYGFDTLKRILVDLSTGMPINESLQRYTDSLQLLDKEFAEYARDKAKGFATDVNWNRDSLPERATTQQWAEWNQDHPNNYWGLLQHANALISEEQWEAAKQPLTQLRKLHPHDATPGNATLLLAQVHRQLGESADEQAMLHELAAHSSDAIPVFMRLAELHTAREDWEAVSDNAARLLAVNPLLPAAQQFAARAAEELQQHTQAASALSSLLEMNPIDPALTHFRLARALHHDGRYPEAKRHVLMALEDAPRYRAAQQLLLQILAAAQEEQEQAEVPPAPPQRPKPEEVTNE